GLKRHKVEHYIVKNHQIESELLIDSLVCAILYESYQEFRHYDILLYKESRMTNRKKLLENDRILDRYSQQNDWIYIYRWFSAGKINAFIKVEIDEGQYISEPQQYLSCDE
ncbi:MAG: hypothetical protein AAGG75_14845, partial [Bacteroidota bacterium]